MELEDVPALWAGLSRTPDLRVPGKQGFIVPIKPPAKVKSREPSTLLVLAPHLLVADALLWTCVHRDESADYRVFEDIIFDKIKSDWPRVTLAQKNDGPESYADYVQLLTDKAVVIGGSQLSSRSAKFKQFHSD